MQSRQTVRPVGWLPRVGDSLEGGSLGEDHRQGLPGHDEGGNVHRTEMGVDRDVRRDRFPSRTTIAYLALPHEGWLIHLAPDAWTSSCTCGWTAEISVEFRHYALALLETHTYMPLRKWPDEVF